MIQRFFILWVLLVVAGLARCQTITIPSQTVSVPLTINGTTVELPITTGSGTSANDFAAAYTLAVKASMQCTGYGATNLWYCN